MAPPPDRDAAVRRRGRIFGIGVFIVLVTTFTVVCAIQILVQVWAPSGAATDGDCRQGLQRLVTALERARRAAAAETGGERAALRQFRKNLMPEWSARPTLTQRCESEQALKRGLRQVDLLRYAEEHAVRYEATDVARLRLKVAQLRARLAESSADAAK